MDTPTQHKNVPALTGLRALAALMVLALHASQNFPIPAGDLGIIQKGYLGVDLFFLLSGFILTYVYFDQMREQSLRVVSVFIWHRFIRLYPVHIAVLFALVFAVLISDRIGFRLRSPETFELNSLPSQFLMIHAWGIEDKATWNVPAWSISAEWFAYLCFPAIIACLRRIHSPRALGFVAFSSLAVEAALFLHNQWGLSGAWIAPQALIRILGAFICGAALCRFVAAKAAVGGWSPFNDAMAIVALLLFIGSAQVQLNDFFSIAFLAMFLAALSASSGIAARVFSFAPIVWLGEISYSLYMVHFPVLKALNIVLTPERLEPSIAIMISVGICILCAAFLYYTIERPTRSRLRDVILLRTQGVRAHSFK